MNLGYNELAVKLDQLCKVLPSDFSLTIASITDFIKFLRSSDKLNYKFGAFKEWWGRGQQYISIRKVI